MGLLLHAGSEEVCEDEVRSVQTPQATETWVPVPHALVLDQVQSVIQGMGLQVYAQAFGLFKDGARFFGLLEVSRDNPDYGMVIGIRNAHDKAFSLTLGCGSHVFICDNLAFSSEVVLKTRHTINIMNRIPGMIGRGVGMLINHRHQQSLRIEAYKNQTLSDLHAHDLMIRAIQTGVIAPSAVGKVIREWYEPTYPDFTDRTVWSAFNAFTHVLKDINPLDMPRRTMALHGLCDGISGLILNQK